MLVGARCARNLLLLDWSLDNPPAVDSPLPEIGDWDELITWLVTIVVMGGMAPRMFVRAEQGSRDACLTRDQCELPGVCLKRRRCMFGQAFVSK